MSEFLFYSTILFLIAVSVYVLVLSLIAIYFMISSCFMHYAPPVPSSGPLKDKVLEDICRYLQAAENITFMDLGSGWGTLLIPLAKKFPQHRFIGIERAFLPYLLSKLRSGKLKNLTFLRGDIFDADISRADVVYCFLMQRLMDDLTPYLKQNLRKGALVYSCRFTCPDWQPEKTVSLGSTYETYYVYKKD